MAGNKNQHFVPRVHFRPFTHDSEGRRINLFNLDRARAISGAAVKGQCSGNYFYGEDLVIERWLQGIEGEYGAIVRQIQSLGYRLTQEHAQALRRFWLLQHLRTDAAAKKLVMVSDQWDIDLHGLPDGYRLELKEAVQHAVLVAIEERHVVDDLEVRLLRNQTRIPFITSDNPAIMTNRWHLVDRRANHNSPGMRSAGIVGILPLAPDILCLIYDSGIHSLPHVGGWVLIERPQDVEAYNAQQILNCTVNVYFHDWSNRDMVQILAEQHGPRRAPAPYRITHAVLVEERQGYQRFVAASAAEARAHPRSIVHSESILPVPSAWPSQLSWRSGAAVYDSGSAVGFVRKAGRERGFRKLAIRK